MRKYVYPVPVMALTSFFIFFAFSAFPTAASGAVSRQDEFARRFLANYVSTLYNTDRGNFPSDEANTVLQTRDGYIWFGGYNGLQRFDGSKFTVWDAVSPNGFGSSNIRALHEDKNGTLWIGTNDKGLVSYRNGKFTAYGKADGAPSNTVRDIAEHEGRIYCGTPEGLFYVDLNAGAEGAVTAVELDTLGVQPFIISLSCDSQGSVYMVLYSGELFAYAGGKTVRFVSGEQIRATACVSGGRIVAGTRDGNILITRFDGETFAAEPRVIPSPLEVASSVYEDSNGYIWVTAEKGVGFLDRDEKYHNVGSPNWLGFYTDICEDYQNGYWIPSSKGGVVKLTESAFYEYEFNTRMANADMMDEENTYIGTDNGLFILDENARPVLTDFTKPIQSRVRGIFHDSRGDIWICTYADFGVIRYTPRTGEQKNWLRKDGLLSDLTRCMAELPNGVVAIGSGGGVNFIKGDEIITANEAFETDRALELPDITVLSMACASDGTLYIGTDGSGVYAVSKNGTVRYREEDGLTGGVVLRITANPQTDGVWVSSTPGLCYIEGGQEGGRAAAVEKVPPHSFLDIMYYNEELILLTSGAILRTDAASLLDPALPFEHTVIDKSSGLTTSINANAWNVIRPDGSLYFCDSRGVSIYNFENRLTPFIPYAGISKIEIDDAEYADFSEEIIIPSDANRLTVDLSYLSFGLLDEGSLRYTLEGQDAQSYSLPDASSVSYTNLKGGEYTFRAWTEDKAGNRGNIIEVDFRKDLKLLERVHVWIQISAAALLVAVGLIAAVLKYKNRSLYRKQREYRTIISQALNAITNAIEAKDSYTRGHSSRVAAYSVGIARRMGMDEDFIENLYYIGLLHDVGKIGIPVEIINKTDRLTSEEYETMKRHPNIGGDILKDITTIKNLTSGAMEHHERWDGRGYNRGMSASEISLEARIIAAADTYDAMSSDRSYRKGLPKDAIVSEFRRCKGSQFDPQIAEVVLDLIEHDQISVIGANDMIDRFNEGHIQN